jgi:hypothetical protein
MSILQRNCWISNGYITSENKVGPDALASHEMRFLKEMVCCFPVWRKKQVEKQQPLVLVHNSLKMLHGCDEDVVFPSTHTNGCLVLSGVLFDHHN